MCPVSSSVCTNGFPVCMKCSAHAHHLCPHRHRPRQRWTSITCSTHFPYVQDTFVKSYWTSWQGEHWFIDNFFFFFTCRVVITLLDEYANSLCDQISFVFSCLIFPLFPSLSPAEVCLWTRSRPSLRRCSVVLLVVSLSSTDHSLCRRRRPSCLVTKRALVTVKIAVVPSSWLCCLATPCMLSRFIAALLITASSTTSATCSIVTLTTISKQMATFSNFLPPLGRNYSCDCKYPVIFCRVWLCCVEIFTFLSVFHFFVKPRVVGSGEGAKPRFVSLWVLTILHVFCLSSLKGWVNVHRQLQT